MGTECINHFNNSHCTLEQSLYNKPIDCLMQNSIPISIREGVGCLSTPVFLRAFKYQVVYYDGVTPFNIDVVSELIVLDIRVITKDLIDMIVSSGNKNIAINCNENNFKLFHEQRDIYLYLGRSSLNVEFVFLSLTGSNEVNWNSIPYYLADITKQLCLMGSCKDYYSLRSDYKDDKLDIRSIFLPPKEFTRSLNTIAFIYTSMPDNTIITRRDYISLMEIGNTYLYNVNNDVLEFPTAAQRLHLFYYNTPTYFCINQPRIDLVLFYNLHIFIRYMVESYLINK